MQLGTEQEDAIRDVVQPEPNECIVMVAKALSDPIRVRMVKLLAAGRAESGLPPVHELQIPGPILVEGICVNEFQECFQLGQSKVSYHLRVLRETGLVREESRGKWSFYVLNRDKLSRFVGLFDEFFM